MRSPSAARSSCTRAVPAYYDEVGRGNLTADQERELLEKLPVLRSADRAIAARQRRARRAPAHVSRLVGQRSRRALRRLGPAHAASAHAAAMELRVRSWLAARAVRRARWQDPAARLRSRHRDVPPLRRAHRRHSRQARLPVQGAGGGERRARLARHGGVRHVRRRARTRTGRPASSPASSTPTSIRRSNRGDHVGDAQSFLVDARGLLTFALAVMTEVAADPGAADRLLP